MPAIPARLPRRLPIRIGLALALAAAGLLLADASTSFRLLAPSQTGILALLGLLAGATAAFTRAWRAGRAGALLALPLICVIGLSLNAAIRQARRDSLAQGDGNAARRHADRLAGRLQADFHALLERMSAPLQAALPDLESRRASSPADAFDLLDRIDEITGLTAQGHGLSLYDPIGAPLAWSGWSAPPPAGLLTGIPEGRIVFRAVSQEPLTRLYAILSVHDHRLVVETTITSRLDPGGLVRAFPSLAGEPDALFDPGEAGRGPDSRGQAPGGGTGRSSRRGRAVELRDPDGGRVATIHLAARSAADVARSIDREHRAVATFLGSALPAGLGMILFAPRPPRRSRRPAPRRAVSRLAAGLSLIWAGRIVLSILPPPMSVGEVSLHDSSLFASAGLFDLLRSPADLLFTCLALLGSALLAVRAAGRLADARPSPRAAGPAGWVALALVVAAAAAVPSAARHFVGNSNVNLLVVEFPSASPATLALQLCALLALLALFLAAQAGVVLAGAGGGFLRPLSSLCPRPGSGSAAWVLRSLMPGLFVAALLYDPLVVPQTLRAVESDIESSLMPQVINQRQARRAILQATMDSLETMHDLPDRILSSPQASRAAMALDIWLRTPLKDSGYNASLQVVAPGPERRVISRFARNLPPIFEKTARMQGEGEAARPVAPMLEEAGILNLRRSIWHAEFPVEVEDHLVGVVIVHAIEGFDNLPFLTAEKPYARALTPQPRRLALLPAVSGGLIHAVYGVDGRPLFWNQHEAPPLPDRWEALPGSSGSSRWSDLWAGGRPVRCLFFSDGEHIFCLGFPLDTPLQRAARTIRAILLGVGLLGALLLPVAILQARALARGGWPRLVTTLGATHFRKLLTTFSVVTLVPLLALWALMSGYLRAEVDQDVEERGRQGILTAGSMVRTMIETSGIGAPDDDTLYWLSVVVGDDVNLYQHGDLIATSRPELFDSGLLPARQDGRIYRSLALDRRQVAMGRERLRGIEYRTITSAVAASAGLWEGHLALPLDAQTAAAIAAARDVADALLLTITGMVGLMGAAAYLLARRVSRPIRSLREAAGRIAAGHLDTVVTLRPRDETGQLISNFNQMAAAIKEQQEDLRRRRDYIEKILLNATIGVLSMDREGRIVTVNPAAVSILDLPDLKPGASLPALLAGRPELSRLLGTVDASARGISREVEISLHGSEPFRTVRGRCVPFLEGREVILLLEDVTETVRSNRLAAWAEMARRIAHEIKNPLTPIQLSTEHIRRVRAEGAADFDQVLEECLRTIAAEVAKLRQISSEFSTYSRIPALQKQPTDPAAFLAQVAHPYRTAPPAGVTVTLEVAPGLPEVEMDRSLMGRVVVNLIENALQAMPRGGTLALRARGGDGQLAIEVADTGVGVEPAALVRIFEPYFSTKDSGTGLGLAIARRTVEEHGGRIDAFSSPGQGTTMRILLALPGSAPGGPDVPRGGDGG